MPYETFVKIQAARFKKCIAHSNLFEAKQVLECAIYYIFKVRRLEFSKKFYRLCAVAIGPLICQVTHLPFGNKQVRTVHPK